jgi:hopanoid-associated phosphorylase
MIAVVVGMKSEARLVPGVRVACSGGLPTRAAAVARILLDEGAEGLVSLGIAGGLDPTLAPGDLVIGSGVEVGGTIIACDGDWTRRLLAQLPHALSGLVYGGDVVAANAADKRRLHDSAGAVAVDLESGAVAQACAERGKPFAVIRTIADPAGRGIPAAALAGLDAQGNTRPLAVIGGLLRRPQDLPALIRVGLDSAAALRSLAHACDTLGQGLAFEALEVLGQ